MPAQWTGELVGRMHNAGVTAKQLAAAMGKNPKYVSQVLNILSSPNVEDSIARTPARKRFTPPTLAEVTAYCRERQNAVDPQRFIDYYTANGWKVGKNSMKDWKAAVRTWEGKQRDSATAQRSSLDETRAVLRRIAGGTP